MKIIMNLSLIIFCQTLYAQKVKLEQGRLYVDNENWGKLNEKYSISGHNTLLFYGIDGKKWMEAQYLPNKINDTIVNAYKITFYPQNRIVFYKEGMEFKNTLCLQLVKSGAFTKSGTYDKGIDKFERNFALAMPEQKTTVKITNEKLKVTLVERDRNAAIFVVNGLIKQDFKLIATYREETISRNDSTLSQITFLDIKGIEIAKASFEHLNGETATLSINNYKEPLIINLNKGNQAMKIEEIVRQLIYLKRM
jgi:hypothetical protein